MNNFKKMRLKAGYTQRQLADRLYVNQTAVSQWERGVTNPNPHTLLELCELYGTTADYLLGRTDVQANYEGGGLIANLSKDLLEHFNGDVKRAYAAQKAIEADGLVESQRPEPAYYGDRIRKLRAEAGISGQELAQRAGLTSSQISKIETGVSKPSLDALERICIALDISFAEFFAEEDSGVTTRAAHLSDSTEQLPPEAEKELEQLMDYLRHKYGNKQ